MQLQQQEQQQAWAGWQRLGDGQSQQGSLGIGAYLVHHADNESFLLDIVGLDSIVIFQDFSYAKSEPEQCDEAKLKPCQT